MRRKKERSKQGQTNKQGKATQHSQGQSLFLSCLGWDSNPRHSRQSAIPLSYQSSSPKAVTFPRMSCLWWDSNPRHSTCTCTPVQMELLLLYNIDLCTCAFVNCCMDSWSCHDANSPPRPHPLNKELGLATEALLLLQASECRATVTTESGKLATFYDSSLRGQRDLIHVMSYMYNVQ